MPTVTSQFWAGKFNNKKLLDEFFEEDYKNNKDLERPISLFAASQNEQWIDHDFLERGYKDTQESIREKFISHSYAERWMNIFEQRVKESGLTDINTIIMCSHDKDYAQVNNPVSFKGDGYDMVYLGTITYDYEHPQWFQDLLNDMD